jgi:L-phenylalanine/L-methionine N-acetyltransferase
MAIEIRAAEPSDYEGMRQILEGHKAVWGTTQLPFPSSETWRKRLAETAHGDYRLVACIEQKLVGQLTLHTFPNNPRRRHVGCIGMAVHDDHHGQGIGTALMKAAVDLSDNWLNILKIELEVYTDNEAALRLYKKFVFTIEGTLIRNTFRAGKYVDTHAMARFRGE